ncbi:condensin complex subunit 3 [Tetranychus urticae]|uniref:Nuclear condensin complex subunit 3 C-terminal domain-containing protein n=1 Tax=Tetranychus urticae TaxID=32264 RepID=T1KPF0_TETUR|nr:condensin complex subunit 3 [Tetranychus urticae]
MKLRKRDKNPSASSAPPAPSATSSTSSSSSIASSTAKRAGKSTRGRSKAARKILKEKHAPNEDDNGKSVDIDIMADIFQKCQHLRFHEECISKFRVIYHEISHKDFCSKLSHFIRIFLRNDPKSPFTKHCIQFIPKLINTLDNEKKGVDLKVDETVDELGESMFGEEIFTEASSGKDCVIDYILSELLIKELASVNTAVRQNSCSLILRLLHGVNDIRRDIYNSLQLALLDRLADRNFLVRALAAYTLRRFQDTSRPDDPVLTAYRFHLTKDPAFQVRLAVLMSIEASSETLHFIIKKVRDVKAVIRKQAYIKLAEHVPLKMLSVAQRNLVLKEGLNDRHPNVRKTVEERLLAAWLKHCDDDVIRLLVEIDVLADLKISKKILYIYANQLMETACDQFGTKFHSLVHHFRQSYLDHDKLLIEEHLTPEKVLIWQCLNTFIKSNEDKFIKLADKRFVTTSGNPAANTSLPNNEKFTEAETLAEEWANQAMGESSNQLKDDSQIADYLLPELPHMCQYLRKFVETVDSLPESTSSEEIDGKEFVYKQLVSILLLFDVCDEAQQNYLLEMIHTIIFSPNLHIVFEDSISPIMKFIARRIFKDSTHLLEFTAECTSKVYNLAAEVSVEDAIPKSKTPEPSNDTESNYDVDYARLTMEIEEIRDKIEKAETEVEKDHVETQKIKMKLIELQSERERLQARRAHRISPMSQQIPPSQVPLSQPFNLNDHPETLLKCLQIFVGALEHGKFDSAHTLIFHHIDSIVIPGVIEKEERIRALAVKALGLSCILSDSLFKQHCNLLMQILSIDSETIRIIALQSFLDCLCKHGIEPLIKKPETSPNVRRSSARLIEDDIANLNIEGAGADLESIGEAETQADLQQSMMEDNDEDAEELESEADMTINSQKRVRPFETLNKNSEQDIINSLVEIFTERLFNCGIDRIEESAIEGFAKLMILGVIYSPSLLSRFIITWYLPETKPNILQFLGVFIPIYVGSESKYVREDDHIIVTGQTCLVDCFIDTLEILYEAKNAIHKEPEELRLFHFLPNLDDSTQYRQIDLKNVTSFMLNLVKPNQHKNLLSNLLYKMFSIVTSEDQIYKFYEDFLVEYLLKAALRLSLDDIDDNVFGELRPVMMKIITRMKARVEDMRASRRKKIEKFIRSFLVFYKSLGRGELNASMSRPSSQMDDEAEAADYDELDQMEGDLDLDPLGSMPGSKDDSKENNDEAGSDGEKDEEIAAEDDCNDDVDSLSDVSETLRWSDIDEPES